ncbi:hypothetical protein L3Q82_023518 [Scortum barcoo]|uniref:Uncharacterized protein n=1 Tax=Scortum barcoo TaxID=214431 RepID=A0ACB8WSN0_9TELE|nr:hypothetical protein L3Q82_023518 [Scortum barcoo]
MFIYHRKSSFTCVGSVRGITLLSLPWEGLRQGTGEENSADSRPSDSGGTMRFSSLVVEHWTSSIPSTGCLRVYGWEFAQPVHMCFVDLEKAFDRVPRGILWEKCSMRWRAFPLRVGGEVLPQVEEFKYLGVLFTSEGKIEREIDRRIGAASAVMRSVYRTVVVKKELSRKAKLSIYRSIYVPTLTYGHELWVMTERTRSRIQAAEMSFLRRVAGRSLRDRVRSSVTREELGGRPVEPLLLHIERSQLRRWLQHLFRMPPGRLPREVFQACPTGRRPRGRPRTCWRDYASRLAWEDG